MKKPTLFTFIQEEQIETHGWNIRFSDLRTPLIGERPDVKAILFESSSSEYACLFYSMREFRMGSYGGLIALYEDKLNPKLIVNPAFQWFHFSFASTLTFEEEILIVRLPAYNKIEALRGYPFVVIDLRKRLFGFIDLDFMSIYYKLTRIKPNVFKLVVTHPREIELSKRENRAGEQFKLDEFKSYSLEKLNDCIELYFEEKKMLLT